MRQLLNLIALSLLFATGSAAAQEGPGTKFRGLYINMTKAEAEAFLSKDFKFKTNKDGYMEITFLDERLRNRADPNGSCAIAHFDSSDRIDNLGLWPCFFNAADLSYDAFIQEIRSAYSMQRLDCSFEPPNPVDVEMYRQSRGMIGPRPTMTRRCKGFISSGEFVDFTMGALMVGRRSASQRPTFN